MCNFRDFWALENINENTQLTCVQVCSKFSYRNKVNHEYEMYCGFLFPFSHFHLKPNFIGFIWKSIHSVGTSKEKHCIFLFIVRNLVLLENRFKFQLQWNTFQFECVWLAKWIKYSLLTSQLIKHLITSNSVKWMNFDSTF